MLLLDEKDNPVDVYRMGVRIFPDGREDKSKSPLSVLRREKRGTRRNLDRYLERREQLLKWLDTEGFLPQTEPERTQLFAQDPLALRVKGLDESLSLGELGRAFIHLAKRRGFKSNRKANTNEKDSIMFDAMHHLEQALIETNSRTVGEYLFNRNYGLGLKEQHLRKALRFRYDASNPEEDRIFPTRAMIEGEFDILWEKQVRYQAALTPERYAALREIIFYQRPLKPVLPGNCTFEPGEHRCAKAHPYFQISRIWQDVNNLQLINVANGEIIDLSLEQKHKLFLKLNQSKEASFSSLRKELFKKEAETYRFNFENETRTKFKGNEVYHAVQSKLKKAWENRSEEQQIQTIELLIGDEKDEQAVQLLQRMGYTEGEIEQLIAIRFPDGYGSLSLLAIRKILPYLQQGYRYDEACTQAGYNHSHSGTGEVFQDGDLPYYGALLKQQVLPLQRKSYDPDSDQYGRINNPTVHIGLNQLRHLLNAMCKRYGAPKQIVVELARDLKMGEQEKIDLKKRQRKNLETNERITLELEKLRVSNNYENRTKFKLWEELNRDPLQRCCIYTGKMINMERLFSPDVQIEHILPKSRTFDDSNSNKTLSYAAANRYKGERSPFEAFGESRDGYQWEDIVARAQNLPNNKRKRFQKNAMELFKEEGDVIARMLNDTRYMSRVALTYVKYVCGEYQAWAVNGMLTARLRKYWGLNSILDENDEKNRTDHRHHAIDAMVIGLTSRSTVKLLAEAIRSENDRYLSRLANPFEGFNVDRLREKVNQIIISYRPDQVKPSELQKRNQTAGALMEETAYGLVKIDEKDSERGIFSVRKDIGSIRFKDIESVKSPEIKKQLIELMNNTASEEEFVEQLKAWAKAQNIKKVRMLVRLNFSTMIKVLDKTGNAYKYYSSDENLCADVYNPRPFDPSSSWKVEIINSYAMHQQNFTPEWKKQFPMAKLVMRLYKNDVVAYTNDEGIRELRRVRKMTRGTVYLREMNVASKEKSIDGIGEIFSGNILFKKHACKAGVDILGRLYDPKAEE